MLLLQLVACGPKDSGPALLDSGLVEDTSTGDDTGTLGEFTPPCDGDWGWAEGRLDPAQMVHVAPMASGDGSMELPMGNLAEALEQARATSAPGLMIWPGTHDVAGLTLSTSSGDQAGFTVCGCGPDSILAGDDQDATLWISDLEATVAAVGLSGGLRGLVVRGGADVTLEEVSVSDTQRVGVIVDGSTTTASLSNMDISGVSPVDDIGWGLAVQGSSVVIDNLHIVGGHGFGAFVHEASVDITGLEVTGTQPNGAGLYGRGLHMQQLSSGTLSNVTLSGNADAGLYALQSVGLVAENLHIDTTSTGLTDEGAATGDGIVVTAGDSGASPETFGFELSNSTVESSDRAGVLLDGVAATLNGNTVQSNGVTGEGGVEILLQGGALVEGSDAAVQVASELPLNIQVVAVETLD